MERNLKQLKCGECGEEKHRVYIRENGELITECIFCNSQSEIVVTKPQIRISNNLGLGTICIFND